MDKVPRLTRLDLSYTKITEKSLYYISKLPKIKYLFLWSGVEYPERYYDHIVLNI